MSDYLSEEIVGGVWAGYIGLGIGINYAKSYLWVRRERRTAMGKVHRPKADPNRIRELEEEARQDQDDWERRISAVVGKTERTVVWDQSQFNKIPGEEPERPNPFAEVREVPAYVEQASGPRWITPQDPFLPLVDDLVQMNERARHDYLFGLSSQDAHDILNNVHLKYQATGDSKWKKLAGEVGHYYAVAIDDERRRKGW